MLPLSIFVKDSLCGRVLGIVGSWAAVGRARSWSHAKGVAGVRRGEHNFPPFSSRPCLPIFGTLFFGLGDSLPIVRKRGQVSLTQKWHSESVPRPEKRRKGSFSKKIAADATPTRHPKTIIFVPATMVGGGKNPSLTQSHTISVVMFLVQWSIERWRVPYP